MSSQQRTIQIPELLKLYEKEDPLNTFQYLKEREYKTRIYEIKKNAQFKIGRFPDNDIIFQNNEISRTHVIFGYDDTLNKFSVQDNNSTNGSYISIPEFKINQEDEFYIGSQFFKISSVKSIDQKNQKQELQNEIQQIVYSIQIQVADNKSYQGSQTYEIQIQGKDKITIGKIGKCDLHFPQDNCLDQYSCQIIIKDNNAVIQAHQQKSGKVWKRITSKFYLDENINYDIRVGFNIYYITETVFQKQIIIEEIQIEEEKETKEQPNNINNNNEILNTTLTPNADLNQNVPRPQTANNQKEMEIEINSDEQKQSLIGITLISQSQNETTQTQTPMHQTKREVREHEICPLCNTNIKSMMLSPCYHTFCQLCCETNNEIKNQNCPFCREPIEYISFFQTFHSQNQ